MPVNMGILFNRLVTAIPAACAVFAGVVAVSPASAESLRIAYVERAPYYYTENGEGKGTILDRTRAILAKAGIEGTFASVPSKRVLEDLGQNSAAFCSVNWKKNPDREKIGNFSAPAFPGQVMVAVVKQERVADFRKHPTLKAVTEDASLRLGAIDGWTLGPYIDSLMAAMKGNLDKGTVTTIQNLKKVAGGHLAYTLLEKGEVDYAVKAAGFDEKSLVALEFPDIVVQLPGYFWCSRQVEAGTLGKIDAAIAELYPDMVKP